MHVSFSTMLSSTLRGGTLTETYMPRVAFILVAGLDQHLFKQAGSPPELANFRFRGSYQPVVPAVTCSMQATLTTGLSPAEHGIIANGLFTHDRTDLHAKLDLSNFAPFRKQTSFWEQASSLVNGRRFWHNKNKKTAMMFWQQSMPDAADIILTPKPDHTPDGKTISICWSRPTDLYPRLAEKLGQFPLHHYWGPMAGMPSSEWIIASAREVWQTQRPDLLLLYVPQLDYNLQRLGPDSPVPAKEATDVSRLLGPLIEQVRADGGVPVVAGDYGITAVNQADMPNLALRRAGLLTTIPDEQGKLLIDYTKSRAVAMVDHQIAHVYCSADALEAVVESLRMLPSVDRVLITPSEKASVGLGGDRTGTAVLLSRRDAWFAHDWWESDAEKPAWQFSVDIHRKPGYDPRELLFDPVKKCICQDVLRIKGSHGAPSNPENFPMLFADVPLPAALNQSTRALPHATDIAAWLQSQL